MDYRKFLGATQSMVLPYLGGLSVHAIDRRLRVSERVAVGWWRFEVKGRLATPKAPSEPPPLQRLPALRGHLVGHWLFTGGDAAVRVHIMPEEEAPPLSPAVARRWAGGDAVFDALAFEDEAEAAARAALHDAGTLAGIKGAVPSLRGAFGFACVLALARARGIEVSVHEVLPRVHAVADGTLAPAVLLEEVEARVYALDPTSLHREHARAHLSTAAQSTEERAMTVLEAAGAYFLRGRSLGEGAYEVMFRYLDEQFVAVVDAQTLHVFDAGICLDGHDEQLGLDSLPSVIAEAIDSGALHVTRR